MRLRAARILRRYGLAEKRYYQLERKMNALEVERMALLRQFAARIEGSSSVDLSRFEEEMSRIDRCIRNITKPWQQAHSDLYEACGEARRLLREAGMSPVG